MLRKLMLTSVVVLVSPGTTLQLYFGSIVCVGSAIFYIKIQPYRDNLCARVQAAILLQLMATYLTASLFVTRSSMVEGSHGQLGSIILTANGGAIALR